ncbi:saposin [Mytilus galloprovincialis]|uniref:Saposin n=1 Tax=Mytilus galloprovincialis TaxID=29158 RepID=A0A8B6CIT0_MYTGA|nr:saposin [Mytilus galloprovincialis]
MIWKISLFLFISVASVWGAPSFDPNLKKDYLMCEVCHVIVRDLQILVAENNTQAKAEGVLTDICNRLTANADTCLAFVKDNIGKVFSKLSDGLDPEQICISLKVCPSLEQDFLTKVLPAPINNDVLPAPASYDVLPVSNDVIPNEINEITQDVGANPIECELCKLVVSYVEKRLLNNKSEDAINATLEEICNELPGQLGALCQKFEPLLLKALVDEFSADKACKAIKVCTAEDAFIVHEHVLSCKDCKEIMEGLAGETGIQVCLQMAGICGKSKTHIHHELTNSVEPEKFEEPSGVAECTLCKFVMREVDNILSANKSEAAINASLQQICNSLPDQLQGLCQQFAPILLIAIKNGLDPNMACTTIKLCNNDDYDMVEKIEFDYDLVQKEALEKYEKEEENNAKASIGCTVCKFIIQEIDHFIVTNESSAAINATVYNLCSKLPAPLDKLCYGYAPVIVQDVVSGFDPELTCEKVKLCTNDSIAMTKDFPSSNIEEVMIKAGPECAICKLIVQEIDSFIAKNETASQINATVYAFCGKLPGALTSLCMTYAPIIVNDVVLGFDPEKTCEKVKLCTNDSISWSPKFGPKKIERMIKEKVEASPGCTLCKFIVQAVSNYTTQNQSAAAINASVYQVCNELPALLKNLCQTYAPIIINDITAGFDPEQTCEKVQLCKSFLILWSVKYGNIITTMMDQANMAIHSFTMPAPGQYNLSYELNSVLQACGQLCNTSRKGLPGPYFDHILAPIDCNAILKNEYVDRGHGLPLAPATIPIELMNEYSMNNRIPVRYWHLNSQYLGKKASSPVWTVKAIEDLIIQAKEGKLKGNYGEEETNALRDGLKHAPGVKDGRVLVIGSEFPWVEACVLEAGAREVVTLEYGSIISEHPKVKTMVPFVFRMRYLNNTLGTFDAIVSFSSLEHSGLGRYGDALNPWGDIIAVARAWCVTKHGGSLTIGVQYDYNHEYLHFNADRVYGKKRYPYLTTNWKQLYRGIGKQRVHVFTK